MIPFFRKNYFLEDLDNLQSFYTGKYSDIRSGVSQYCQSKFLYKNFHLTKSCTQSLEIAIMSLNLPKGSEVILPSYGFVSIANAVVINGLKCVFVDCDSNTMNISIPAVLNAITEKTKAIITINYSGIACDYDQLLSVCNRNEILLIEDNAHGICAKYKESYLGTFGDISTMSFDFFKNINCGEGGGIIINNSRFLDFFYKTYNFGTNKKDFLEGNVNAYEWKQSGTNAILAEPLAVILKYQLDNSEQIIQIFKDKWQFYYEELGQLENDGNIELVKMPEFAEHNAHMFWLKVDSAITRANLISYLGNNGIEATFHYKPLHTSEFGKKVGEFRGEDINTTKESEKLIRLPFYYSLKKDEQAEILDRLYNFFKK